MKTFFHLLQLAAVATISCGLVYLAVQQSIRAAANDPQIQTAEDLAALLSGGRMPNPNVNKVDVEKSLAVFVMVYDANGNLLTSSAELRGQTPQIPKGVFDYVKQYGEDRVTWQPERGVRAAIVVAPYESGASKGYVVAGRSLREAEKRVDRLLLEVLAAWATAMVIIVFFAWLPKKIAMPQL